MGPKSNDPSVRYYDTAIIGGGPAACGLLTNHALNNEYEEFLDRGVVVFETSSKMGGGALNRYHKLHSNSHGCAFFDAFQDLSLTSHDDSLNKSDVIPMTDVHLLQEKLGAWHLSNLEKHPMSRAMMMTTALSVVEQDDHTYLINFMSNDKNAASESTNNSEQNKIVAKNVCICSGGKAHTPSWLVEDSVPIQAANDYFSGSLVPCAIDGSKKVAIVGFSHSAFSLGHMWHNLCPQAELTFIRRRKRSQTMPYIYFPSVEEAKKVDYDFKKADICPETGRIHRFGGLRGDAREFALQSHLYKSISIDEFDKEHFDHVIVACGFQIHSVPLYDKDGVELVPEYTAGGTRVDAKGRLFDNHRIYAFGVGAGLVADEEIGGEPGCTRRSDGIWLYQYAVGSKIRKALKEG